MSSPCAGALPSSIADILWELTRESQGETQFFACMGSALGHGRGTRKSRAYPRDGRESRSTSRIQVSKVQYSGRGHLGFKCATRKSLDELPDGRRQLIEKVQRTELTSVQPLSANTSPWIAAAVQITITARSVPRVWNRIVEYSLRYRKVVKQSREECRTDATFETINHCWRLACDSCIRRQDSRS